MFLLFYFTLFVSDITPKFFAIDNIDASLNPRLCRRLMQELVQLAKKHDKQVIITTPGLFHSD
ncbi:AAA family ATPase [Tychonema sp. LEGE 06208]|uniref:AAA family ATPase n=1 Tax=Microcoleaceae TaxID=1892252 RepID=UPI001D13FD62|nr:AAA family ATPase [Tychonema sp. LEGE 06208]